MYIYIYIYIKGPTCEPGNYRPVALTSIVCKLLERNIKNEIIEHLKDMNFYN